MIERIVLDALTASEAHQKAKEVIEKREGKPVNLTVLNTERRLGHVVAALVDWDKSAPVVKLDGKRADSAKEE